MLIPTFTTRLGSKINPGCLAVGKFDGKHPCLVGATVAGKVFIHDPHGSLSKSADETDSSGSGVKITVSGSAGNNEIVYLNINQSISCVAVGKFSPEDNDILFVGTPTNLMAYDVFNNKDVFYNDFPDGANAVTVGVLGSLREPLVLVGGNCALQGFNSTGEDSFWTVTGDNVRSMTLVDFTQNGRNELVVGSDDFDVRVFREDEILAELTETEAITCLCGIAGPTFGYGLANGTVGVYDRATRAWRIKSRNQVVSIVAYDVTDDGQLELVTGWSNGKVDARNVRTGEVVWKDTLPHPVASLVCCDYRLSGREQLIVASVDGEVRGYQLPASADEAAAAVVAAAAVATQPVNVEQEAIRELTQRKQNLALELRNYEENQKAKLSPRPSGLGDLDQQQMGIIPADTQMQTGLDVNLGSTTEAARIDLQVATTNDTFVRVVIIFAEGIFDGESLVVHPHQSNVTNSLLIPIRPPKDVPVDLHIKAFVGYRNSVQFHVFEMSRQLPRFAMYGLLEAESERAWAEPARSSAQFQLPDRAQRVLLWLNREFLLKEDLPAQSSFDLHFMCLRDRTSLRLRMDEAGQMTIESDNMSLTGDLIHSLAQFLNIQDLQVLAEFPSETDRLRSTLSQIDEIRSVRDKLSADLADQSNLVRELLVRAEDSRLIGDFQSMKQGYKDLFKFNQDLIGSYRVRCNNHEELLRLLRAVNQVIQRAGRLRVGQFSAQVVSACRSALKKNQVTTLLKVIKTGAA